MAGHARERIRKGKREGSKKAPVEAAVDFYFKFIIPSYNSWILSKRNKIVQKIGGQQGTNYIEMDIEGDKFKILNLFYILCSSR